MSIFKYKKHIGGECSRFITMPFVDGVFLGCELATIGDDTYVFVPDETVLPEQHSEIADTVEAVVLTDQLRADIIANSPVCRFFKDRVAEKIREQYSQDDESAMQNKMIADLAGVDSLSSDERAKIAAAYAYFKACRDWGRAQIEAIGLA